MPRKLDDENRRAAKVNPTRSGVRTGNPQLKSRDSNAERDSPRQRPPRHGAALRVKKASGAAADRRARRGLESVHD